jgi:hypothetical protein
MIKNEVKISPTTNGIQKKIIIGSKRYLAEKYILSRIDDQLVRVQCLHIACTIHNKRKLCDSRLV